MSPGRRYLGIYLNDHLAGAAGGLALARRCLGANPDPPLGEMLAGLVAELEADQRLLESVLRAHGVRRSPVKPLAALVAERLGRLKLNGQVRGYSPLSRLVELEGLCVGVTAKRMLWEALLSVEGLAPDRAAVEEAHARAGSQLDRLEGARRDAVAVSLRPTAPRSW